MFKRVLYSVLIVLAWLGFVVEGSHALFSDFASLSNNSITTGTVDLQISNSQNGTSTVYADVRPGFAMIINPGESDDHYLILKNASQADTPFDIDVTASPQGTNPELFNALTVDFTPVDTQGTAVGAPVSVPMLTLVNSRLPLGITINKGSTQRILVHTKLAATYASQNQSITYDLTFNGTQHAP